jgi:hypothetical protein
MISFSLCTRYISFPSVMERSEEREALREAREGGGGEADIGGVRWGEEGGGGCAEAHVSRRAATYAGCSGLECSPGIRSCSEIGRGQATGRSPWRSQRAESLSISMLSREERRSVGGGAGRGTVER